MTRKVIKRYMPDAYKIRTHKHLRMFGKRLHDTMVAVLASAAGYWAMRGFWRLQTVRQWERRKRARERKT